MQAITGFFGGKKEAPKEPLKDEKKEPEYYPPTSLPLYKGLQEIYTQQPKKIACGLNHTAAIANVNQDREIFLQSMEKSKAKNELYIWGRNMPNNLTGCGTDIPECPAPQRSQLTMIPPDMAAGNDFNDPGPYEVSLGANHTMVLMTGKSQETDKDGKRVEVGQVFGMGLGSSGRLGVPKPSYAKDESWFTENQGGSGIAAVVVKFEGAFRVIDKPKDGPKTDGINYHNDTTGEGKDRKAVITWGSNVHGEPDEDYLWLKVQDKDNGIRFLPMVQEQNRQVRTILPVKIQILRLACGGDHTMALATNGVLYSWGLNNDGQCGVDSFGVDHEGNVSRPKPVVFPSPVEVQHFACGSRHSLAVDQAGALFSWGCGEQGRLGIGKATNQFLPVRNTFCGDFQFTFVACGEAHSGAIDSQERVWTWGAGAHGRLGHGETVDSPTPMTIEVLEEIKIKMLALGGFHSIAVCNAPKPQKVYTWGMGHATGQSADGKSHTFSLPQTINLNNADDSDGLRDVTQIAAGAYHSMFLLKNGTLLVCGLGNQGRLGLAKGKVKAVQDIGLPTPHSRFKGYALKMKSDPTIMNFRRDSEKIPPETTIVTQKRADGVVKVAWDVDQIGCGQMHSAIRTVGGQVFIWGDNDRGQLGLPELAEEGKNKTQWFPRRVNIGAGNRIIDIAIGEFHSLAVTEGGAVYAWGKGDLGQLGTGRQHDTMHPTRIDPQHFGNQPVIKIAAGEDHSGAIVQGHEGNSLYMWGNSENGKLGLGPPEKVGKSVSRPKEIESRVWGEKKENTAAKVPVFLACSAYHTAVIVAIPGDNDTPDKAGEIWAFGGGLYGRLGIKEKAENVYSPEEVKDVEGNCLRLSIGAYHSASIMGEPSKMGSDATGDLFVWGLGKMVCEPENLLLPKKFNFIEESTKFSHVSCSSSHTLVVMESGVVYAWGDNQHGQCGVGPAETGQMRGHINPFISRPRRVKKIPGTAIQIVAGQMHSLAYLNNGDIYAWGNQSCGRLGLEVKIKERNVSEPHKVKAEWASIEEITVSAQNMKKHNADDEEAATSKAKDGGDDDKDEAARMLEALQSGQKVQKFATMQSLLKTEAPQNKEHELQKLEKELTKEIQGYLDDIMTISHKEKLITQIEADLTQGLGSVVRCMKAVKGPVIACKVNPKIMEKLSLYEELMWVLQQQPCYLASLSATISGGDQATTFNNIVSAIFAELEDSRTLHLYMTLLKLLIDKEVEKSNNMSQLFNSDSLAFMTFSWFAKRPQFYEGVVWKYMRTEDAVSMKDKVAKSEEKREKEGEAQADPYSETLLSEILKKKDTLFALDKEEFKSRQVTDDKDGDEMAEFMASVKEFKDFMTGRGPFEVAVAGAMLHPNIRQILFHCFEKIQSRTFSEDSEKDGSLSIPKELKRFEPLLKLVLNGILIPLLEDPQKYAGVQVFCSNSRHREIEDGYNQNNINVIWRFLKDMVAGKYDDATSIGAGSEAANRTLNGIALQCRLFLLRHCKELANAHDDTETYTTIDVYMSHYDRHAHFVAVQTVDLLNVSNMLSANESKVRQTDDDPCVLTCQAIGHWDKEIIDAASGPDSEGNVVHNFVVNNRFLLDKKYASNKPLLTVCRTSAVPMPSRFCVGNPTLIKQYTLSDSADSMSKMMEDLFREIEDVNCTTWAQLIVELERQLHHATAKNPPNFVLAHKLKNGISKVDDLKAVDYVPMDLMNDMSDKLMARARHRVYLEQVQKGLHVIRKAQLEHSRHLRDAECNLKQMADFAATLKLPDDLMAGANSAGSGKLTLQIVKQKMVAQKLDRREKLSDCMFAPTTTVSLSQLKKEKIVFEVHESVAAPPAHNKIRVTMSLSMDGGLEVDLNMQKHKWSNWFLLRQFKISCDQLVQFKKFQDGTKQIVPSENENVMTVDPARLAKFISQVTSGG